MAQQVLEFFETRGNASLYRAQGNLHHPQSLWWVFSPDGPRAAHILHTSADMDLIKTLSYNYVFRGLPKQVVAGIAAIAELRTFMGGDVIVRQFDRSNDMFVILEGQARIKSYRGDSIAEFGPGSILGEMALIDEQPRSATVTAIGTVTTAVISADVLRGMMEVQPEVAKVLLTNISRVLCRRIRTMNTQREGQPPAKIA